MDMGGSNPYISQTAAPPAQQKFTITFLPMNVTIEVNPEKIPYGVTGQPGSILDIALAHGIEIDHACGGVLRTQPVPGARRGIDGFQLRLQGGICWRLVVQHELIGPAGRGGSNSFARRKKEEARSNEADPGEPMEPAGGHVGTGYVERGRALNLSAEAGLS